MQNLQAINNRVIFQFLDATGGPKGTFSERTNSSIIIGARDHSAQTGAHRWGKIVSVGQDVKDLVEGDFILIQNLQWTPGMKFENQKIWMTTPDKVLAITRDESDTLFL